MKKLFLASMLAFSSFMTGASEVIKLGVVLPFSGGLELFGEQAKAGIDLAVKEINAKGGISGRLLEVFYEDNKTDPKTSVEKTIKLIRKNNVLSIIGPITSNARDAMLPTISRQNTPLLYATNYEGGVCDRNVFMFNTVPNQELAKLIPALAIKSGKTFFMFGADYVWPQQMFEQAEKEIAAIEGQVVGKEFTPWGTKDFTPTIRKIKESGAKVLLFALPGADGITFIKQANELGLSKDIAIGFLGYSETYRGAFGENNRADIWVAAPFIASHTSSQAFVASVKNDNPKLGEVSHYLFSHYNAVKAMAAALEKSGEISKTGLINGLKGLEIQTSAGKLSIDANTHHASLDMFLANATSGQALTTIIPLGMQTPQPSCQVN